MRSKAGFVIAVCAIGLALATGTAMALTITVGDVSANPGQTGVVVSVGVDNAQGIAGGDLVLAYDSSVLTAKEVKAADLLSAAGITVVSNLGIASQVKVAMAGAAGIASGSGALVTVTFDVKAGAAAGAYTLDLQASLWDENGAALPSTVKKGTVTVKGATPSGPSLTLSVTSLSFDSTKVGATTRKALILTNAGSTSLTVSNIAISGTDAAQFKVTPMQFTLAAKGSKSVTVSFTPTTAGAKSASLSILHSGAGSPATVSLSGKGIAVSSLTMSATSLSFDSTKVGATTRKAVTLTNAGSASLSVSNIAISGADVAQFKVTPMQFTLAAKGTRSVTVSFTPTSAGAKSASLSITYSGAGSPATVNLSGKGVAVSSLTLSASSLIFEATKVGETTRKTLTLSNAGSTSLNVSNIAVSGTDAAQFKVTPAQFTLAAKGNRSVTVSFTPTSAGAKSASLSITYNGSGSPAIVSLSGKGIEVKPEGLQVSVGTGTGSPGSSVTVPIAVNDAKGIAGGDLTLSYDAQVLKAKEVKAGDLLSSSGITAIPNLGTAGQVKVAMAGAAGIASGSGALLQVTFEVLASAAAGTYELGLEAVLWDENGNALPATVEKGAITVQAKAGKPTGQAALAPALLPNYPNPFNSATLISYQVANAEHVQLAVYNLLGQQVRVLVDQVQGPGSYQVVWDGRDEQGREVTSGIYLWGFQAGSFKTVRRLALVR